MAERPIIFSASMVRAIIDGRKSQTRRVLKPQPIACGGRTPGGKNDFSWPVAPGVSTVSNKPYPPESYLKAHPLRYAPSDLLWVREAVRAEELESGLDGVRYVADDAFIEIENTLEAAERWIDLFHYAGKRGWYVPSLHMPRWASRITLRVTDVRVERLQEISDSDCIDEGVPNGGGEEGFWVDSPSDGTWHICDQPRDAYRWLWDKLNDKPGKRWNDNPWVAAISFERIKP